MIIDSLIIRHIGLVILSTHSLRYYDGTLSCPVEQSFRRLRIAFLMTALETFEVLVLWQAIDHELRVEKTLCCCA